MLTIYTIHHLRTARQGVILGMSNDPVDPSLRPLFKSQTREFVLLVSDLLARGKISAGVYTSSMRRQKETSQILFGDTELPIIVDERLRQFDLGPQYTGMNSDAAKQEYLSFIDKPFPQGESFNDFAQRIREFLDEKSREHGDHTIITIGWRLSPAIFAHVCRGVSLDRAIVDNANITGPYYYQ